MASISRNLAAYVAAVVVSYGLGSFFHTEMVFARFAEAAGEPVALSTQLATAAGNFVGLWQYAAVFALALVGFAVAAGLKRVLTPLAPIAYPLAGAAAIALALFLMSKLYYATTPIAGARGALGFSLQCLAGAVGGLVFSALTRRRA